MNFYEIIYTYPIYRLPATGTVGNEKPVVVVLAVSPSVVCPKFVVADWLLALLADEMLWVVRLVQSSEDLERINENTFRRTKKTRQKQITARGLAVMKMYHILRAKVKIKIIISTHLTLNPLVTREADNLEKIDVKGERRFTTSCCNGIFNIQLLFLFMFITN